MQKDLYANTLFSFKSLKRDLKELAAENFFLDLKTGPKGPQNKTISSKQRIIELRKKSYSIMEIQEKLKHEGTDLSLNHINSLLKKEGFAKLF